MSSSSKAELRAFKEDIDVLDKAAPNRIFLDTNTIISLHQHEMAVGPKPPNLSGTYGRRRPALIDFLRRAKIAGRELVISPAVVEEVFYYCWRKVLKPELNNYGCGDEKELRRKHPDNFAAAKTNATKATQAALTSAGKHGIVLLAPLVTNVSDPRALGRKIVDSFILIMQSVPQIGGRDAMHIIAAEMLDCKAFASNDGDFRFVSGTIVYCENPTSDVR